MEIDCVIHFVRIVDQILALNMPAARVTRKCYFRVGFITCIDISFYTIDKIWRAAIADFPWDFEYY